jgi:hypothetical protein
VTNHSHKGGQALTQQKTFNSMIVHKMVFFHSIIFKSISYVFLIYCTHLLRHLLNTLNKFNTFSTIFHLFIKVFKRVHYKSMLSMRTQSKSLPVLEHIKGTNVSILFILFVKSTNHLFHLIL